MKKEPCYLSAKKIAGPCGPCSFINLIGLKGSSKLEKELAEIGRLKPFHFSDFTSFLIWAEKYNKDLEVYVESKEVTKKFLDFPLKFENVPNEKEAIKRVKKNHKKIVNKHLNKVKKLRKDPLEKMDELLEKGYWLAFGEAHFVKSYKRVMPHLRVVYKKEKETYFIKDSALGLIKIKKERMVKELDKLKEIGIPRSIIAYKK